MNGDVFFCTACMGRYLGEGNYDHHPFCSYFRRERPVNIWSVTSAPGPAYASPTSTEDDYSEESFA